MAMSVVLPNDINEVIAKIVWVESVFLCFWELEKQMKYNK